MPMPVKTFSDYGTDAGFLMSEAPGRISREQVVLAAHAARLIAGTVLGAVTANGQLKPVDPAATDGSQTAVAVLMLGQKASPAGPQRATVVSRQCEVAARMLVWPTGITENQKKAAEAQLASKTILVRY